MLVITGHATVLLGHAMIYVGHVKILLYPLSLQKRLPAKKYLITFSISVVIAIKVY